MATSTERREDLDGFDLQAHRGGIGLRPENTLAAFRHAIDLGVSTLECDVNVSLDGRPMVTHDAIVDPAKNRDTAPTTPGDPMFPYVGKFVSRLTSAQLSTLDCGSARLPAFPDQVPVPGEPMPVFDQVLALAEPVAGLRVNVEAKFDVLHPEESRPREVFVETLLDSIRRADMVDRVSIQSFDWEVLTLVAEQSPRTRRYALTAPKYLEAGRPGASPWLAGLDVDDYEGDVIEVATRLGFDALSPTVAHAWVDAALVGRAHAAGILVVPYTVDDPALMRELIGLGVDGFITNYPDLARAILASRNS